MGITKRRMAGWTAAGMTVTAAFLGTAGAADEPEALPGAVLEELAGPYIYFRQDVAALEGEAIAAPEVTRDAHFRLGSYDPEEMTRAYVAYLALVAADSPIYADSIEKATKRKRDREAFIAELASNPVMVRSLPGSNEAIADVMAVVARDSSRIAALAQIYIDHGYSLQSEGWAKAKLPMNGQERVREAQAFEASRPWEPLVPLEHVVSRAGNVRPNLELSNDWTPEWSPVETAAAEHDAAGALMTQALILAARYNVGDMPESDVTAYTASRSTQRCVRNAKLDLNQCIAASRSAYEEAFCIGTHGLGDVADCVGWPASVTMN